MTEAPVYVSEPESGVPWYYNNSQGYSVRGRLFRYKEWISNGWSSDLLHAVRIMAARDRKYAALCFSVEWERRQRGRALRRWQWLRQRVLASGDPCAYCGDPEPTTVDHVIPIGRRRWSQPHDLTNLAPACRACNSEKRNRTPDQWKAWRLERGLSWPPHRKGWGDKTPDT